MAIISVLFFWSAADAAAAAEHNLRIDDTIGRPWQQEPIQWESELPPREWNGDAILVRRDGEPIVAQPVAVQRHADRSVKKAVILFLIDKLDANGSTIVTAQFGVRGPAATHLKVTENSTAIVLENGHTAAKVVNRNAEGDGEYSPLLGVRTASGRWIGSGRYVTTTRPKRGETELIEKGPIRLRARITVSLWTGSRCIDLEEDFDLGPNDKYQFKQYHNDRDELGWEWWSWYGDRDGTLETHPNNWVWNLSSPGFEPLQVRWRGESSTASDKGESGSRGESAYSLKYSAPRRLEKYLAGHGQWRPDAVTWYGVSPSANPNADAVAVFTHSQPLWRNPNVLPTPQGSRCVPAPTICVSGR